jgi:DNA-binding NtrC family response regulator/tetratricopeptide (TPR) repeat protein
MSPVGELVGESPGIVAVRETISRLLARQSEARRLPPILIQGETGTGKGLVARALHQGGPRPEGPFVDVNCAAIPETLLEAEMFGFERGAFTDARQAKRGLFQAAHRGTMFLDEVGLLPEGLQGKLLKAIEERAVRRLGSTRSEPVDAWVLTATSTDLVAAMRERRFREDLYHRLAVVTVWLPPLRERGEDILQLGERFLARACGDYEVAAKSLTAAARAALLAYPWPGNVRELINVMERVALLSEERDVTAEALALPAVRRPERPAAAAPEVVSLDDAMGTVERAHLLEALRQTNWNISRAAARLGIPRNTLRYRIEKHGLRQEAPAPRRQPAPPPVVVVPAPAAPPAPPEPAAAGPAVRWERRRLALLRVVLLSAGDEPDARDPSRALAVLVEKVQSFGGQVAELGASGIVAAFGLEPVEDAPRRAAHAAMAIHKAAERDWGGRATGVPVKSGIHAGQFSVGRLGETVEIDQDAKHPAWALLDRLVDGAEPGAIVVSEPAAPFLERRFELLPIVGAAPAGQAYRLGRPEGTGFERRPGRFVGRQRELELLRSLLATATRGRGQVVGIVGEAGIGKSRLLFEFRQSLGSQPVTYREGHCVSYGNTIAYLPMLDLLRGNCGITELDSPETIRAKVRVALKEVGMDPEEGAPYLLHLLGVKDGTSGLAGFSPEVINARTFETLRQMSLHGSRRRPIVLAVEDLHWIDKTSEEYLASLVESFAGVPILFIATYRPGYRPAWMEKSYVTQIALPPLSPQESLAVIQSLPSGEVPDHLAQLILAKAQGNPFFLEELTRTVGARGGTDTAVGVPDTIHEVLLARIERLPVLPRQLLQTASVLGREVSLGLLAAIWEGSGDPRRHLRELVLSEFLYEQSGLEEPLYVFKHPLIQEVVYDTLAEEQRRRWHTTAGRALETLYAGRTDEVVEILAFHFGQTPEAEKAVDYAIRAAEKAQRRWANAEALAHFESALTRLATMADTEANRGRRIDAVIKQAEVKFALGQLAAHLQALEGIRPLVEAAADPRRRAEWLYWMGYLHSLTGSRPEVAIAYCREASAIADAGGFEDMRAFVDCCLSQVYLAAADLEEALSAGERALATFEARGNLWWGCRALWALTSAANAVGDWERSLRYCQRGLEYAQALNDVRLKVIAWWRMGWAHIRRGDPAAGLRCCEEGSALSPSPFDAAMVQGTRGHGLVRLGEVGRGTAELAEAVAWLDRSSMRFSRTSFAVWLGEAYFLHGERSRARVLLEEVLASCLELGYRGLEGVSRRLLAQVLATDDPAAAGAQLEAAARILDPAGARDELAKAWVAQAGLRLAAGDRAGARDLLKRALGVFEALGSLDEPPRVRAALASLAAEGPDQQPGRTTGPAA